MSELTAKDLMKTLTTDSIKKLFKEALIENNPMLFHVTADELIVRSQEPCFHKLLDEAFSEGLVLGFNKSIADAMRVEFCKVRKYHPLNYFWYKKLEEFRGYSIVVNFAEYNDMMNHEEDSAYDGFCAALTPAEVLGMTQELLDCLVEFYRPAFGGDWGGTPADIVQQKTEEGQAALREMLQGQINYIVKNEAAAIKNMQPNVCHVLQIDKQLNARNSQIFSIEPKKDTIIIKEEE